MDRKFYLNRKMNVNLMAAWFWTQIARVANKVVKYSNEKIQTRIRRNIHIARLMERENYVDSFQIELVSISNEFGHS